MEEKKVLFTGFFSSGKSTLINALIGKSLLNVSAVPETAACTEIRFCKDNEKATIVYTCDNNKAAKIGKEPGERKELTLSEYRERFRIHNNIDVETIDHIEIDQTENILGSSLCLVDSPGFDNVEYFDYIEYKENVDAVVFLINATKPLSMQERDRMGAKYYKKQLKNVFIVVTWADAMNSSEEMTELKARIYENTHAIFVDERGHFDEELRNNRVFL